MKLQKHGEAMVGIGKDKDGQEARRRWPGWGVIRIARY